MMTNKLEIRKLAELACGTSKDSPEYKRFIAAMNPTLLLDLTANHSEEPLGVVEPVAFGFWRVPKGCPLQGMFVRWTDESADHIASESAQEVFDFQMLFTSPPAPVAVGKVVTIEDETGVKRFFGDWCERCDAVTTHETRCVECSRPKAAPVAVPEGWKLVPIEPTEAMLNVLHDRVLISVNSRKQEANILNDKAWWKAVVDSAPACLDKVKELNQ